MNHKIEFAVNAGRLYQLLPWEVETLLRASRTLQYFAEDECNGTVSRDESTGKVFRHYGQGTSGPFQTVMARDIETPARKRIEDICKNHGLVACFQGDPRGAIVTICKPEDVKNAHDYRGLAVPS